MVIINIVSNIFILFGSAFFLIGIFGRRSEKIESMTLFERSFIKISLAVVSAGSLLNLLTNTIPPNSEIVLNLGSGLLFLWAAYFHWKFFVLKQKD